MKAKEAKDSLRRLQWFTEARFGMFVHWGLYSIIGRHEWVMNRECISIKEYEKLADKWKPGKNAARGWAQLAKKAGMRYMVLTAKHHEGFCLWDTKQTDYNSCSRGPRRDLVREFVEACREFGLKVGLYYSLMDWHHPDGGRKCITSEKARRRFLDFTQGCVCELCSNYGKIDILWYDQPYPLATAQKWESAKMNAMARILQPDILINNRAILPEDFRTPEETITPAEEGRAWESCMTLNGAWGYTRSVTDWLSPYHIIMKMLLPAANCRGNLLLNVGPMPDGAIQQQARDILVAIGKWIAMNGEALYGDVEYAKDRMEMMHTGNWSIKGLNAYFWCYGWPGTELILPGMRTKIEEVSMLGTGQNIKFVQKGEHLVLKNLPQKNPDRILGIPVFKIRCKSRPSQFIGRIKGLKNIWIKLK